MTKIIQGLYYVKPRAFNPHTFLEIKLIDKKYETTSHFKGKTTFTEILSLKDINDMIDKKLIHKVTMMEW